MPAFRATPAAAPRCASRCFTSTLPRGKGCLASLFCLLTISTLPLAISQRPYPLLGQDGPFPADNELLEINTTVLLERITSFDEFQNNYGAIWWVVLSWRDPSAAATVAAATTAFMASATSCSRPCDSAQMPSTGCCDGMWLPHIELPNVIKYDEDQQPRYRINANASSGVVTWSTRLVGTWYAPLDFRAYPFDHQHILMEMALAGSQSGRAALKWQHVAQLNNTAHTKGPDLSGWHIKWAKAKLYDSRNCFKEYNIAEPRYAYPPTTVDALAPNDSASTANATYQSLTIADCHFADNCPHGTTTPTTCGLWKDGYAEAQALYSPVVLIADFMLQRVSSYYVLTNVVPVLLITLVAFVVFFMPQTDLGDRMGVVLTMFLSLTAMQFVFDFPPANYINALQMVVLVSYIMIAVTCVESLLVHRISTVSDAVGIKRSCMRKYGTMLSRGVFDRHLKRELSFATKGVTAAGGVVVGGRKRLPAGGGGGTVHPSRFRGAASAALVAKRAQLTASANTSDGGEDNMNIAGNANLNDNGAMSIGEKRQVEAPPANRLQGVSEDSAEHLLVAPPSNATRAPSPTPNPSEPTLSPAPSVTDPVTTATLPPRPPTRTDRSMRSRAVACYSMSTAVLTSRRRNSGTSTITDIAEDSPHHPVGGTLLLNPLARSHVSFAVDGPPRAPDMADIRSVASSRASTTVTFIAGVGTMCRRSLELGFLGSMRVFFVALHAWMAAVAAAPGQYYRQCKEDPSFARFVAARIDKWCCIVSITLYIICVSVLLWVESEVGDHKLMLGDAPGNM